MVVVAAWLANMPVAALSLVACTTSRLEKRQSESFGFNIEFEWMGTGVQIGHLKVQPGKPGTTSQILDFLNKKADLMDPVLFAGWTCKQLVLDDQLDGWPSRVVVTSANLTQLVEQVDFRLDSAASVCQQLARFASHCWTDGIAGLARQLIEACLPRAAKHVSWLVCRTFLKHHDADGLELAARFCGTHIYNTRSAKLDGKPHDIVELATVWRHCWIQFLGDQDALSDLQIILSAWLMWFVFDENAAKAIVSTVLASLASLADTNSASVAQKVVMQAANSHQKQLTIQFVASGMIPLMKHNDFCSIGRIADLAGFYNVDLAAWLPSQPTIQLADQPIGLIQFLLQARTTSAWEALMNLAKACPRHFFGCFVQHLQVDHLSSLYLAKLCENTQDHIMQLDVWTPAADLIIAGLKANKFCHRVTVRLMLCRALRAKFVENDGLLVLAEQLDELVQLDKKNHLENAVRTLQAAHCMVKAVKPQRADKHGEAVLRAHEAFIDWVESYKRRKQKKKK